MCTRTSRDRGFLHAVFCLVLLAGTPRPASGAGPDERHSTVTVQTNFEGEDVQRTQRLEPALKKRVRETLQLRHGVTIDDTASVVVVLSVRTLEEDLDSVGDHVVVDYGVQIEVLDEGKIVGDEIIPCLEMGEAQLIDCAADGLQSVVQYLPAQTGDTSLQTGGPSSAITTESEDPEPKKTAPIGPVGYTGIAIGVAGLAAAIAGGVYLARGNQSSAEGAAFDDVVLNPKVGGPTLGVGLGFVATGAIMTAIDVGLRARRRKAAETTRVSLKTGHKYIGLNLRCRF